MILNRIKTTPGYWAYLYFEDDTVLPVTIDDLVRYHLVANQDLDQSVLTLLIGDSFRSKINQYCLYQLGLSPKSKFILTRKLKIKINNYLIKYPVYRQINNQNEIIEQVIASLEAKKLFNEKDYVDYLIRKYHHLSKQAIIAKLRQNGVNSNLYHTQLSSISDQSSLIKILTKKINQIKNPTELTAKRKLFGYLVRKGFAYDEAKRAIDELTKKS